MLTARIEKIRQNYVNAKPQISCERAALWTESYKKSEGKPACIRSAQAFYDCCAGLGVHIFEGELIVGAIGEFRKCGILHRNFPGSGSTARWTTLPPARRTPIS